MKRTLGLVLVIGSLLASPVQAAVSPASLGLADVEAACLSASAPGACSAAVQAYIARAQSQGLSPDEVDQLMVALVVDLGSSAANLPPAVRNQVAAAIQLASTAISNPDTARLVVAAAADVSQGINVDSGRLQPSPA